MLTWIQSFFENEGTIKDHRQGHYQRPGILWYCESLSSKAAKYIRENTAVKGRGNLICFSFCEWVNEDLLQNSTLEPGFPRQVSVETAQKWMHEMGFQVQF